MIKPNEVRVGNWVLFEGKPYQLHVIAPEAPALDTAAFGVGVVDWRHLQPIPITWEILSKNYDSDGTTCNLVGGLGLKLYEGKWHLAHASEFCLTIFEFAHFQYLHQLQNLYHSLTGKELTLTP